LGKKDLLSIWEELKFCEKTY